MLDATLNDVSANCLRGQAVPGVLRALWEAQVAGDCPIGEAEFGEVELVSRYDDEFFEGYSAEFCGDVAIGNTFARIFREIAFIGREAEGGLLGYWLGSESGVVAGAPVVLLDNEGQFQITAATLQDHFVQAAYDDADAIHSIRAWFRDRGFPTQPSAEAVWEAVEGAVDVNDVFEEYLQEEKARGE